MRNITFSIGEYYHTYNRGVDKRKIFTDKKDYERFLKLLLLCNSEKSMSPKDIIGSKKDIYAFDRGEQLVEIGSYCLMPNHFHVLIKEISSGGISKFMGKLSNAYSKYFNKKYDRTGHLFEGVFKSRAVVFDEYLKYLFAYINLNPIKIIDKRWKENGLKNFKKSKKYLETYRYSSYLDFIGEKRDIRKILDLKGFPEYFSDKKDFEEYLDFWLNFQEGTEKITPH